MKHWKYTGHDILVDLNPYKHSFDTKHVTSLSTPNIMTRHVSEGWVWWVSGDQNNITPASLIQCRAAGAVSSFLSGSMFQTSYDKFIPTLLGWLHSWNTTITGAGVIQQVRDSRRYNIRLSEVRWEPSTHVVSHQNIFIYLISYHTNDNSNERGVGMQR